MIFSGVWTPFIRFLWRVLLVIIESSPNQEDTGVLFLFIVLVADLLLWWARYLSWLTLDISSLGQGGSYNDNIEIPLDNQDLFAKIIPMIVVDFPVWNFVC